MTSLALSTNRTSPRLIVNLVAIIGVVLFFQGVSLSMVSKEFKIAHNLVAPILDAQTFEKQLVTELTMEQKKQNFNNEVRKKYKRGAIIDVDEGVKHIKLTRYYQGSPVRLNIIEINQNINPNLQITPTLASETLARKSSISTIAKKNNSIVAINGTFFKPQTGVPLGTLMIDKKMYTGPIYDRVAMGIFDNGFDMARVQLNATLKSKKIEVKVDNINQPRMLSSYVLVYTRDWGKTSPTTPKYGTQIAIADNKIVNVSSSSMEIPENGFVVVGPASKLEALYNQKKIELDVATTPDWKEVKHIISGGPYLVKNEQIFVDMTEQKLGSIGGRNPRTAIGYTKDNHLILIAVDGRENSSIGMTLMELAYFMKEIGCVNAMNLDGGGSTVMYVDGRVVNAPATKGGIALSNALTVNKI